MEAMLETPVSSASAVPETALAEAVHAATLGDAPIASNAAVLDNAAPETVETHDRKLALIEEIKVAFGDVRGVRLSLGPKQAVVVGKIAELLCLKPTNKELAAALMEPYDEGYHGERVVTSMVHSDEYVDHRDDNTRETREVPKPTPNPYAQSVRRYKILAQIEAKIPGLDGLGNPWDFSLVDSGVTINSVTYLSPVAALNSGVVTLEAVFQAWTNILQPRVLDLRTWSTSHVAEAKAFAPKVKVTVRQFDKKMNREAKASVVAVKSASCLYGLIMGLLEYEDEKNPITLGRERADKMIAAINAKVNVADADPK